jgi:hypothetical protein
VEDDRPLRDLQFNHGGHRTQLHGCSRRDRTRHQHAFIVRLPASPLDRRLRLPHDSYRTIRGFGCVQHHCLSAVRQRELDGRIMQRATNASAL